MSAASRQAELARIVEEIAIDLEGEGFSQLEVAGALMHVASAKLGMVGGADALLAWSKVLVNTANAMGKARPRQDDDAA